jgi:hypothetical protein
VYDLVLSVVCTASTKRDSYLDIEEGTMVGDKVMSSYRGRPKGKGSAADGKTMMGHIAPYFQVLDKEHV